MVCPRWTSGTGAAALPTDTEMRVWTLPPCPVQRPSGPSKLGLGYLPSEAAVEPGLAALPLPLQERYQRSSGQSKLSPGWHLVSAAEAGAVVSATRLRLITSM